MQLGLPGKNRTENTVGLLLMSTDDPVSYDAISSVWCYNLLQVTTVINCNLKNNGQTTIILILVFMDCFLRGRIQRDSLEGQHLASQAGCA